jgi:hypothetical protein
MHQVFWDGTIYWQSANNRHLHSIMQIKASAQVPPPEPEVAAIVLRLHHYPGWRRQACLILAERWIDGHSIGELAPALMRDFEAGLGSKQAPLGCPPFGECSPIVIRAFFFFWFWYVCSQPYCQSICPFFLQLKSTCP